MWFSVALVAVMSRLSWDGHCAAGPFSRSTMDLPAFPIRVDDYVKGAVLDAALLPAPLASLAPTCQRMRNLKAWQVGLRHREMDG